MILVKYGNTLAIDGIDTREGFRSAQARANSSGQLYKIESLALLTPPLDIPLFDI